MIAQEVVEAFEALPAAEKAEAKAQIAGLPAPPNSVLGAVWMIIIITLAVVVVGGGLLVFLLVNDDKDSEVLVGFVSAALGAIIGLLAPSPAAQA